MTCRSTSLSSAKCESEKDNISGHIGGKDVPHGHITAGVNQSGDEGQAIERAVQDALTICQRIHLSSILEFIARPNRPIIQITARLCLP